MDFLAPLMLVGIIGVALPIVIHLIGRRRARRVRFAAIDFLFGSDKKVRRRLRLRELLLLGARILACVAVPLALAKPYTACQARGPLVPRGPQAAVLIIDNSFGSNYTIKEETLLGRSLEKARLILQQLGPEAEVAVLVTAEGAEPPSELSRDHLRLRDRIRAIEAAARPADLTAALRRAGQLLDGSSQVTRSVYLLGAPTATAIRSGESPWPAGAAPQLHLVDPADGQELDNLAVTGVTVEPDPESGARGIRVTADVANFSARPAREKSIALRIGNRVVSRGLVTVDPGQTQRKRFAASLPPGTRAAELVVELAPDRLAIDDRRYALAERRAELRILLVNGDPRTVRYEDELFYLAAALRPGDRSDSGAVLTAVTSDELPDQRLEEIDVVVLANVPALPRPIVTRLRQWVEGGGGLWLTAGDNVEVKEYEERMAPLLPQNLSGAVDLVHGARGGERVGRALRLAKLEVDHPIFSVFPADAPGLREAGFSRIVLLGPTTDVSSRRVLARYDNGTAALVQAEVGKGRLLLWTSTIDRDWNDLPIHPGFVPFVQQAVRHLARLSPQGRPRELLVGHQLLLEVGADTARLDIDRPGGHRSVFEGEGLADRRQVRFAETDRPGFYQVTDVKAEGASSARGDSDFAVNLDPRGSDLRRADLSELTRAPRQSSGAISDSHERRVELWHAVAAALLLFLLIESFLVWRN
ncbi:MAG TPA: BatA domain-containing protein [Kofleriaceae bacterium]|nr:BatA domain-containing protein [Kofleriaceae bacterium]